VAGETGRRTPLHAANFGRFPTPIHVWINVTTDPAYRCPGVFVAWRKNGLGNWEALVTWVDGGGTREGHVHTAWVLAEHVRPLS
jgi:hypothetical protein